MMPLVRRWWWYDSGYACGAIVTDGSGCVVDAAPIFRKTFWGKRFDLERIPNGRVRAVDPGTRLKATGAREGSA